MSQGDYIRPMVKFLLIFGFEPLPQNKVPCDLVGKKIVERKLHKLEEQARKAAADLAEVQRKVEGPLDTMPVSELERLRDEWSRLRTEAAQAAQAVKTARFYARRFSYIT